jgi:hypothetical protein
MPPPESLSSDASAADMPAADADAGRVDKPHAAKHRHARHHETATALRHKHGAEIAHAVHGRVRLKIPSAKHNPELLTQIKSAFDGIPGIDVIEIKPTSGSLVIYYDTEHHPDIPSLFLSLGRTAVDPVVPPPAASGAAPHRPPSNKLEEVARSIEDEAEFLAEHSHIARSVVEYVKSLDRQIKRATDNNIDLKILAPVVLAGFTFLEIGAAAATPMWVTLVIFSLNHFVELHAHDADKT